MTALDWSALKILTAMQVGRLSHRSLYLEERRVLPHERVGESIMLEKSRSLSRINDKSSLTDEKTPTAKLPACRRTEQSYMNIPYKNTITLGTEHYVFIVAEVWQWTM